MEKVTQYMQPTLNCLGKNLERKRETENAKANGAKI